VREQNADARPRIANPLKSIDNHDVVLLGSPIWNVRPPLIMSTFAESFDFSGKRSIPLSASRQRPRYDDGDIQGLSAGAKVSAGLAVRGETDVTAVSESGSCG
jgi:Flavodoxin